uniref:Rib/alpha-like domain-containing protein n=1 Tax=Corynebacterium haemomassiliense TaxID=2754726 RepID=UPI002889D38E
RPDKDPSKATIDVTVTEPEKPTDVYPPEVTVTPGGTTEIPAPALPDDATVTPAPSVPDWVEVKPDGNVVVTPPEDVKPGTYPVEVEITRPDKDPSKATIDVTVTEPAPVPEKPTDTAPAPSGSSALTEEERGRCIATGVGFGLPLLALIPIAIGSQVSLPWVDEFSQQASAALQDFNTQLQQKTGLYNPDVAQQVDSINRQLQAFGREHETLISGAGAVAVAALVVTLLWKNCTPGEQLSSESSSQK